MAKNTKKTKIPINNPFVSQATLFQSAAQNAASIALQKGIPTQQVQNALAALSQNPQGVFQSGNKPLQMQNNILSFIQNFSGANSSGTPPQQTQQVLSGSSGSSGTTGSSQTNPYGAILNQVANQLSGISQGLPQQSSGATSGTMGNVNWQLADLPFDSKLLMTQMPKYEEITQTKQNEERPLNYDDIIKSQQQIIDYNNQLKQLNAQNWANFLQQTSGVEARNNILRGLDEQNSNTFQKNFANIQKTGAYGYGYDPYGGLRDLRPAPEAPKFEKPIELKEIGKQTSMTEKTIKSGTDYSTQILSPQQQGTSSSGPGGPKQKMELQIFDVAGKTIALGKEGSLDSVTHTVAFNSPGATSQAFKSITDQLFKYGGYKNFDFNSDNINSKQAFVNFIKDANINGLNRDAWKNKILNSKVTPKYATRDLVGAQLLGWLQTNKSAVIEAVKGFFNGNTAEAEKYVDEARKKYPNQGYGFISHIIDRATIKNSSTDKDAATKYLEAVNALAAQVGPTIFSGLGSLLKNYKDREYIPDYINSYGDDDIARHLVRMSMY